jgi:ATP-binding cassette subfamily B protein
MTRVSTTAATRRQLLDILSPRRTLLLFIAFTILVGAGLELVPPMVMKHIIDGHLAPGMSQGLWLMAVLYLGAVGGGQAVGFLTGYLTALTAQGALHDLRVRLYTHLQSLPLSYHDKTPLGDSISRCTADVDTIDTLFSSGVAGLVTDLVRLVTIAAAMTILSPGLTLISMLVVPPLVWVTNSFRKRIRDAERQSRIAVGMLNAHLHETLGAVEVIRAYRREAVFVSRFRHVLRTVLQAFTRAARYSTLYSPIMQCLMAAVIALLLWCGARSTFTGAHISLGDLTAFVLLFKRFFDPITSLGEEWQTVQSALSGAERIFQILSIPPETRPPCPAGNGPKAHDGIEVRALTFGYAKEHAVLKNISFSVMPGEHVAMVGRTGAGKSSMLHLLGGLYMPWDGQVHVAGLDPHPLTDTARRRVIGVVPQVVQLFRGTVLQNLTLGDTSVPLEAVERAAAIAGLEALIRTLPNGYATPIGAGRSGVQLSSGQRQLLSLARALIWDPAVLLFDEATSSIDSASEGVFRAALLVETRTRRHAVLTVAHRLSTAREADRVIVLEAGTIIELGSPDELIRKGGRFAALLELEAVGFDWREGLPANG